VTSGKSTLAIVIGAIVIVLGLAGIAVMLSGGDDSSAGVVDPDSPPPVTYGDDVQENRPVEVSGAPLPALDPAVEDDPAIGMATPVITGATFDGDPITVGGATGGPTLYVYLAHWCPHCNNEIPELIELANRDGIPEGMNVVGISTAVDNTAPNYPPSQWVVEKDWPWPVLADDVQSTSFVVNGGGGFPYLLLVDTDGTVIDRSSGEKKAEDLAAWIQDALASSSTT
jgi:thiol-disulfide isomerase/thioredoxin